MCLVSVIELVLSKKEGRKPLLLYTLHCSAWSVKMSVKEVNQTLSKDNERQSGTSLGMNEFQAEVRLLVLE